MYFLNILNLEPKAWNINKHIGIVINPEKETERIICWSWLTTMLFELIKIWLIIKKNNEKLITVIVFDSKSLKEELLKKVELKNSVGKNKIKRDTKNIINDQKSPSPDQVTNELFSSFNEIKR